jgi:hypothetical protein
MKHVHIAARLGLAMLEAVREVASTYKVNLQVWWDIQTHFIISFF